MLPPSIAGDRAISAATARNTPSREPLATSSSRPPMGIRGKDQTRGSPADAMFQLVQAALGSHWSQVLL
jgi:hypothetical protein